MGKRRVRKADVPSSPIIKSAQDSPRQRQLPLTIRMHEDNVATSPTIGTPAGIAFHLD
jgi:hypothetical protein